jgi:hypothetical protein
VADDEQDAPRRVRRAHSGRQEQHPPPATKQKARRREVHEGDDQEDDDHADDELEHDELEDEFGDDEQDEDNQPAGQEDGGRRARDGPAARPIARPAERRGPAPRADRGARPGVAIPASAAARRAVENVAEFTGRQPENVVAIEPRDGDWYVDVEVVESHRIPDTTDILAIYQVRLDPGGRLLSYRRTRRYSRGQLDKECR